MNGKKRTLVIIDDYVGGWLEWRATTTTGGFVSHKGTYMTRLLIEDRDRWLGRATEKEVDAYLAYLQGMGLQDEIADVKRRRSWRDRLSQREEIQ